MRLNLSLICKSVVLICAALAMAACGQFFPSGNSLVAISLSPSNSTIQTGKTQQFTATGTLGSGSTQDVTATVSWTSSSPTIATINSAGLATATTSTGPTTITATSGNISASTTLTVSTTAGGTLTVSAPTQSIAPQQQVQFTATQNGSTVTATWSSSDSTIVTIDPNTGLATGISAGTVTITASANGATGTATLTVF